VILDVRSKGEHDDTSSFTGLNIGRIKGSVNINVRELGARLAEIKDYKNQPVFVYCSHSQRSRRASKMLADSGFTKVYNINGGMTALYYTDAREKDCLGSMLESGNSYNIISPRELCQKISNSGNKLFILDVRDDSSFKHISTDPRINAYGYFQKTVNIPLSVLESKLSAIPKNKEIVITDLFGSDAPKAAILLKQKGYENVSFLLEGIDRWLTMDEADLPCKWQVYKSPVTYQVVSTNEYARSVTAVKKDYLLLDIRSADEFANKHKDSFRNIGHLKNAFNIPAADINTRIKEIERFKNENVVIYGFSADKDAYTVANTLVKHGFTNVAVLSHGIFDVRWTAANQKGQSDLKNMVVDIPEINQ
jgi:rhodanese-related sulfurtransferase